MSDGQPTRKLAGKYENVDELERGYGELMKEIARIKGEGDQAKARAEAMERYTKQMEDLMTQKQANPAPQQIDLMDEDGRLDARALQAMIDQRLAPVQKQVQAIPNQIQEGLAAIFNPVQKQMQAASEFWSRDEVEGAKFTQTEMTRFLKQNDRIRKVYETMLGNPDSSDAAYEYVFSTWQATRQPGKSQINEKQKQAATQPNPAGGPSLSSAESEGGDRRLRELENQAAFTRDPNAVMAALRERFKDSSAYQDLQEYAKARGWKP